MKMEHKKTKETGRFKKLSDYVMTFAFLYSSLVCFLESADRWQSNKIIAIIILICGLFSFAAVFRWQIASFIYLIRGKKGE